jgi:hypothetical protein
LRIQDLDHQADLLVGKADRLQKLLRRIQPHGTDLLQLPPPSIESGNGENLARAQSATGREKAAPEMDLSKIAKLRTHGWLMKKGAGTSQFGKRSWKRRHFALDFTQQVLTHHPFYYTLLVQYVRRTTYLGPC